MYGLGGKWAVLLVELIPPALLAYVVYRVVVHKDIRK